MAVETYIQFKCPTLYADSAAMAYYIAEAELQTDRTYFGNVADLAVALRACHSFSIDSDSARKNGEAGLVTGKSEGTASIRFYNKVDKGRYSDLQMTHFGQRLLALIKAQTAAISVSGDDSGLLLGRTISPED